MMAYWPNGGGAPCLLVSASPVIAPLAVRLASMASTLWRGIHGAEALVP
jgi:hypothetical protein